MTEQTKLHAAMAKAFAAIEGATKDTNNPFFKTKYADLSSVVAAIKPALIANELFFTQANHERDGGVCVETIVHHADGGAMSFGSLFVPASKNDAQAYGSALTYARRYSLQTAFGVCPEDDDGNAATKSPVAKEPSVYHAPEAGFITDDQRIELMGMMESMNVNVQVFNEFAGIKTLSMLSANRFNDARGKITEMAQS